VHQVEDWAEVHRLFHREGMAKAAIARRLGMSRNTVARLLELAGPPRYAREPAGSQVEAFADRIAAMLAEDPAVRATVVRERLQPQYRGGVSILKEHLARVRPGFLAARAYQRTGYDPGGLGQVDWWHTGALVPVGRGISREAFGLVTTLPWSGAHATVFTLSRTVGDVCPALAGCTERLGGVPAAYIAHLAQLDFLAEATNIVFLGPPGTGKTHCETAIRSREGSPRLSPTAVAHDPNDTLARVPLGALGLDLSAWSLSAPVWDAEALA
jgi:hypothetical protein